MSNENMLVSNMPTSLGKLQEFHLIGTSHCISTHYSNDMMAL